MLARLAEVRPAELREVWHEAEQRGAKWSGYLYAGLSQVEPVIRDRTLAIIGEVRGRIPGLDMTFDDRTPREDFARDGLLLGATSAGRGVRCLVSRATLEDHFGADGSDKEGLIRKLGERRAEIEALLRQKYLHEAVEEPAEIVLRTADVERLRSRRSRLTKREGGSARRRL